MLNYLTQLEHEITDRALTSLSAKQEQSIPCWDVPYPCAQKVCFAVFPGAIFFAAIDNKREMNLEFIVN